MVKRVPVNWKSLCRGELITGDYPKRTMTFAGGGMRIVVSVIGRIKLSLFLTSFTNFCTKITDFNPCFFLSGYD